MKIKIEPNIYNNDYYKKWGIYQSIVIEKTKIKN